MRPARASHVKPAMLVLGILVLLSVVLPLVSLRCSPVGTAKSSEPGGADRLDTYVTGGSRILNTFPAQAVIDRRDHPCRDKHSEKLNVPDNLQVLRLDFWVMHLT